MTGTFYVNIQSLDYDDYPLGSPTKIGPFESEEAAESFLDSSPRFYQKRIFGDYFEWKERTFGKHSVTIKNLLDTHFSNPAVYL